MSLGVDVLALGSGLMYLWLMRHEIKLIIVTRDNDSLVKLQSQC